MLLRRLILLDVGMRFASLLMRGELPPDVNEGGARDSENCRLENSEKELEASKYGDSSGVYFESSNSSF